jgi:hypothetical protein
MILFELLSEALRLNSEALVLLRQLTIGIYINLM